MATELAGVRRWPDLASYVESWQAMQAFTENRAPDTLDQLWLVEHSPVYTLGQAGKPEHVLHPRHIPVIKSDRGGQVTYHGPGQVVVYVLADLKRTGLTIRAMVQALEQAVIMTLAEFGLTQACRKPGAPGVYLAQDDGELAKIAALGIKVRKGCTYHGVALNVDMDLTPFEGINPCGYEGLKTISMASSGVKAAWESVAVTLAGKIISECRLRVE
nr:lipoyl(octanoyl) transferase LipB [Orrella daihaiensis]